MTEAITRGSLVGSSALSLVISVATPPWLQSKEVLPCRDEDPELFFPEQYSLQYQGQIDEAKAACTDCPILLLCLDWAVQHTDLVGIWAATTPRDRRRIRTGKTR